MEKNDEVEGKGRVIKNKKRSFEHLALLHQFPDYKVPFELCISTTLGLLSSHYSASSAYLIVCPTELSVQWPIVCCTVACFLCQPLEGSIAQITRLGAGPSLKMNDSCGLSEHPWA